MTNVKWPMTNDNLLLGTRDEKRTEKTIDCAAKSLNSLRRKGEKKSLTLPKKL
jgi:hypothetical protein